MSVDLKALKQISEGEPSSKVMVTRRWLGEVYRMLKAAEDSRKVRSELDGMLKDVMNHGAGRR